MAAEGTISLMGRNLRWSSPRIKDLIEFENIVGPLIGGNHIDSQAGRAYAALLCLREHQPEITLGHMHDLRADEAAKLAPMIMEAIPFWGAAAGGDRSTTSPSPAQPDSTGSPPPPDESASPTS